MGDIRLYNTSSRQKETFVPTKAGQVSMYCCGPTTYNFIHVGNARPLVVFDTVRRYFLHKGYAVTFVMNFTDVDDKIIARAKEEGEEPLALAARYETEYFRDADALGAMGATHYPKVSTHMPEIISFVGALLERQLAYVLEGDVYYAVNEFPDYGKLSKRKGEDMLEGARVDVDRRKRNPADFALWKKGKPGEPAWDSPWGQGRPGWHIECSAMSHKYLGESFDIHSGGADLIFPHHENEIAQSEGRFGVTMAKYWLHNGFITVNQEKMSKSLGNFFLVREVRKLYTGRVIRFYLLSVHYRSPLDFDEEKLAVAQKSWERLATAVRLAKDALQMPQAPGDEQSDRAFVSEMAMGRQQFEEAMEDDFNTALAIAALFDLARCLNGYVGGGAVTPALLEENVTAFLALADVLGLGLADSVETEEDADEEIKGGLAALLADVAQDSSAVPSQEGTASASLEELMEQVLALRRIYRETKQFKAADGIRDGLKALGIVVEDTAQGVRWHRG